MKYDKAYYHNEIELVRVNSTELKNKIERAFLRNRISYFIRWDKVSFWQTIFGKKNNEQCKICINGWDKELAMEILKNFEKDKDYVVMAYEKENKYLIIYDLLDVKDIIVVNNEL